MLDFQLNTPPSQQSEYASANVVSVKLIVISFGIKYKLWRTTILLKEVLLIPRVYILFYNIYLPSTFLPLKCLLQMLNRWVHLIDAMNTPFTKNCLLFSQGLR